MCPKFLVSSESSCCFHLCQWICDVFNNNASYLLIENQRLLASEPHILPQIFTLAVFTTFTWSVCSFKSLNTHLFVDSFLYTIDTKLAVMLQAIVDQHNEIKLFCFSNLWTAELMKCCLVSTVPLRSRRYQRTDLTNLWPSTLTMESPPIGGEASRFRAKPRLCTPSMLKIPGA